jgi:hypothetical protein
VETSAGRPPGPPFRSLEGDALGGELADHQGQVGEHHGDQEHGHRLGRPAEALEQRDQRLGQGDGRRGRGQEAGQGDADLNGGEELVGVAGQPGHQPALLPLLLEAPQLPLAQRDQRDLAAREGGVDHHQEQDQPDLEPWDLHRAPLLTGDQAPSSQNYSGWGRWALASS